MWDAWVDGVRCECRSKLINVVWARVPSFKTLMMADETSIDERGRMQMAYPVNT